MWLCECMDVCARRAFGSGRSRFQCHAQAFSCWCWDSGSKIIQLPVLSFRRSAIKGSMIAPVSVLLEVSWGLKYGSLRPLFYQLALKGFQEWNNRLGRLMKSILWVVFFSIKYREYCFFRRTNCNYYLYWGRRNYRDRYSRVKSCERRNPEPLQSYAHVCIFD